MSAALLTSCSGSPSSGSSNSAGAGELTSITVGVLPIVDVLPVYVGIQEGIFKKHGLEVTPSVAQGGAALIPSVLQGSVPITFTNTISHMIAYNKGLPVKYLASAVYSESPSGPSSADHPASILATAPDSPITSVKQLAGKTISINALKGIQELAVRNAVDVGGGDSSTVKFLALPLQQAQGALEAGRVDAISINEPFTTAALKAGDQIIAHPFTDFKIPAADYADYTTSTKYADAHPDVVKNFTAAITEASEWARTHEAAARKVLLTYTKLSAQDAQEITLPYYEAQADPASLQELADLALKYKILDKPLDVTSMLGDAAVLQK
ncbi:ABC transporter substrate-binding protein [Microbacterium kribbense]|uniref:ABC transporter substrate-binding protein n=1 Tax=Microbacterium kribbense TaxID=433645 RepID=UPI0031DBB44A